MISTQAKSIWSYNPVPNGCVFYAPYWHPNFQSPVYKSPDPYGAVCTRTGGVVGATGITMDGNDKIDCGNLTQFKFEYNQPFSVFVRFLPTNVAAWSMLVGKQLDTPVRTGYSIFQRNNGKVGVNIANNQGTGKWMATNSNSALTQDIFQLVGFTYSGSGAVSGIIIYRNDAVLADTDEADALAGNTILNTSSLMVGDRTGSDMPANGTFKTGWVYNRAISLGEVKMLNSSVN